MRTNTAASPISFDSLLNKVVSICCVVCTCCNVLQLLDLARASSQDISQKGKEKRCTDIQEKLKL